jgi:hypothetical protein
MLNSGELHALWCSSVLVGTRWCCSSSNVLQVEGEGVWGEGQTEIYRSDVRLNQSWERQPVSSLPVLISYDEFPAGYSLAGCPPAEPASASPTGNDSQQPSLPYNDLSANSNNPPNFVSQSKGALQTLPFFITSAVPTHAAPAPPHDREKLPSTPRWPSLPKSKVRPGCRPRPTRSVRLNVLPER